MYKLMKSIFGKQEIVAEGSKEECVIAFYREKDFIVKSGKANTLDALNAEGCLLNSGFCLIAGIEYRLIPLFIKSKTSFF